MRWTRPGRALIAASVSLAVAAIWSANPRSAGVAQSCDVELVLDAPADGAEVGARQRLSGWAADRAAGVGTGIEAMRVAFDIAADRADDRAFTILPYGQPRPDVAYALGSRRFLDVGFGQDLETFSLSPGPHRMVVQAKSACGWSTRTRSVRVRGEAGAAASAQDALGPMRSSEVQPAPPPLDPPAPTVGGAAAPLARAPALPVYAASRPARFSLQASPAGSAGASLSWSALPEASAYNVYLGEDGAPPLAPAPPGPGGPLRPLGLNGLQRVQAGISGTTASVGGLNAGSSYRFVVRALNENGGEIGESEPARLTLAALPPNSLTATTSGGGIALSWSEVPGAVVYTVLAGVGNGPLVPDPQRVSITTTSTNIDRVGLGSYRFQVEARDAAGGRLARSNIAQVVVDPASLSGAPLPAPLGAVVAPGPPLPPILGRAAVPPAGPPPLGGPPSPGYPPFPAEGPLATASTGGAAPFSASVEGLPAGNPPAAPGAMAPAGAQGAPGDGAFTLRAERAGANAVRLSWARIRGATSYAIYQAQGATPLALLVTTGNPTTTLSGLASGVSYSFQVRARDVAEQEIATSNTLSLSPG